MAVVTGHVIIDRGWNNMKRNATRLDGHGVLVGLMDGQLAEIGYYNEYGTNRIPSRPFLRRSIDVKTGEVRARMVQAAQEVAGGTSPATALTQLGEWMSDRIKNVIQESPSWAVPNSPMTVGLKGFDHPLIETGAMQAGVEYRLF